MSISTRPEVLKDKIALLQELHRPLEEHWSVRSKYGLDAKGSDYIFKQHITRLEDIYVNHKQDIETPTSLLNMSPVSQLYGINGLQIDKTKEAVKRQQKESNWVDNFQKYNVLTESESKSHSKPKEQHSLSRSMSPGIAAATGKGSAPPISAHNKTVHKEHVRSSSADRTARQSKNNTSHNGNKNSGDSSINHSSSSSNLRSRCHDVNATRNQLIMLGMYRLTPEQEEVYCNFVDMLTTFDAFDMKRITEDALRDAQPDGLLAAYGGTTISTAAAELPPHRHHDEARKQ